jgi:ABC-2 type transport system permease protein
MLVAASFALFGFILGIWADSFEKLGIIAMLILTPLTFLVSGLRYSFYGTADVPIAVSLGLTIGFLALCVFVIAVIFRTGWRLRE